MLFECQLAWPSVHRQQAPAVSLVAPCLAWCWLLALLPSLLLATSTTAAAASPARPLRIWIDEFFFAEGETVLLHEAVAASGGAAVVAGTTYNRIFQLKSYQQASKADVFWTGEQGCYEAFRRHLTDSHAVSCVPGSQAVTGKAELVASLGAAYGERAWGLTPRAFALPHQYAALAAHIKQEHQNGQETLWVLKEEVHRGRGVAVVTPLQALVRGLQGGRYVVAQRFVGDQYLVGGRPFYIRVWAVLMGADPARLYLFDGGVAVFGQQQGSHLGPQGLLVNLWTQDRAAAAPWSLGQLEQHIAQQAGSQAVQQLRSQLQGSLAAGLAAGLPAVRQAVRQLGAYQGGGFQVLGADFLLDAALRPWLLEVNKLPSLARKLVVAPIGSSPSSGSHNHSSSAAAHNKQPVPFDREKERFVAALLNLLAAKHQQHAMLAAQAEEVLRAASNAAPEGQEAPCLQAQQLFQLLAMQTEEKEAAALGFVSLNAQLYSSLACMASPDGSGRVEVCSQLLGGDAPPAFRQQRQHPQQCKAPISRLSRLQRWLLRLCHRLLLEAAWMLAWLQHPAARYSLGHMGGDARSYQLPVSDVRMLSWLQRGAFELGNVQALLQYCEAGHH